MGQAQDGHHGPARQRDDQYVRPKRCKATRDEYEAHKHEMKSEHKHDYETQFATSTRTLWCDAKARFHTTLHEHAGPRRDDGHLFAHVGGRLRADAAAVACANAHNGSRTQRAKKRQRHAANAPRRAAGKASERQLRARAARAPAPARVRAPRHQPPRARAPLPRRLLGRRALSHRRHARRPVARVAAQVDRRDAHRQKDRTYWQFRGRAHVHGRARRLLGQDRARSRVGCARQGAGRSWSSRT